MIPYFRIPNIHLVGAAAIRPFGVLIAMGTLLGSGFALRRARQFGIPRDEIVGALICALGSGFVGAHLFELFLNNPNAFSQDGLMALLPFWLGIDSFGGLLSGIVGVRLYYRVLGKPWVAGVDAISQGLVVGWIFGRLGCAIAHDHLGGPTSFCLAVGYPEGPRHNVGLYEFLLTLLVIFPVTLLAHRYYPRPGACMAAIAVAYGAIRLPLDILLVDVPRFAGLTMAQYGAIALLCFGFWKVKTIRDSC